MSFEKNSLCIKEMLVDHHFDELWKKFIMYQRNACVKQVVKSIAEKNISFELYFYPHKKDKLPMVNHVFLKL
jgi:hypothetical protein